MRILAVDTSGEVAAVAVMEDEKLLGEFSINHKKTHSQKLLPIIEQMLTNLEIDPKNFDFFAASCGPGSFTGLRIGITTIKTMAYVAQKPTVAVPTLDALANNISDTDSIICPIMDARNNQVFTALYAYQEGKLNNITEYMSVSISELVSLVLGKDKKCVFLGDAVAIHRNYLRETLGDRCIFAKFSLNLQRASSVAEIAMKMIADGRQESCFDMLPNYLRKAQAERMFEMKAHGG